MPTLFDDPVDRPEVQVRHGAHQTEVEAANKALGRSGATRFWAFKKIAQVGATGRTAVELAYKWAEENPCEDCGCTHQPPIPVNQWGTRLGELQDAGLTNYLYDSERNPVSRTYRGRTAMIHVLTDSGLRTARRRGVL